MFERQLTSEKSYFVFPETAGKPLEEVTEMFEDPAGIKFLGTPAWKTRSQYKKTEELEHGVGLEKKLDDEHSPERVEEVVKQDV